MGRWTAVAVVLLGAVACGSSDEPVLVSGSTPPPASPSTGVVIIGRERFAFVGTCYEAGAGDVVALGDGTTTDGEPFHVLVQAFFGDGYVSVQFDSGERIEPALDGALDLHFDGTRIDGADVAFVKDLDLATGSGESVGTGSVAVECAGFERLPDDYGTDVGVPTAGAGVDVGSDG